MTTQQFYFGRNAFCETSNIKNLTFTNVTSGFSSFIALVFVPAEGVFFVLGAKREKKIARNPIYMRIRVVKITKHKTVEKRRNIQLN